MPIETPAFAVEIVSNDFRIRPRADPSRPARRGSAYRRTSGAGNLPAVVGKTVCMDIPARQLSGVYRVQDVSVCSTDKE